MAEDVVGPGIVALSSSQCASAKLCLWSGTAYTGSVFSTSASSADVGGLTSAGSVWNRRSVAVRVYSGTGGSGTWTCIASGQQSANTALKARSVKALTTSTC
ncbi:peptidase inhibitor family I36 protein [Cellulomonas hominis]